MHPGGLVVRSDSSPQQSDDLAEHSIPGKLVRLKSVHTMGGPALSRCRSCTEEPVDRNYMRKGQPPSARPLSRNPEGSFQQPLPLHSAADGVQTPQRLFSFEEDSFHQPWPLYSLGRSPSQEAAEASRHTHAQTFCEHAGLALPLAEAAKASRHTSAQIFDAYAGLASPLAHHLPPGGQLAPGATSPAGKLQKADSLAPGFNQHRSCVLEASADQCGTSRRISSRLAKSSPPTGRVSSLPPASD